MKRPLALLTLATVLAVPSVAGAVELGTPEQDHPYRSAQNFALELRFGPYKPQIDDEPGLTGTPYKDVFGTMPRLLIGMELDWQTLRIPHLGTIGPGLGVGYTSMGDSVKTKSGRESGDKTDLDIYPFWAVAVLRADVLWRDLGFPIVPYGKVGLGYALWRASNTGGTSNVDGVSGKGGSFGTQLALVAALGLDALDLGASRNLDNATGINGTYLFVEAYWLALNGLGQSHALHVGSQTWTAGLAFEF